MVAQRLDIIQYAVRKEKAAISFFTFKFYYNENNFYFIIPDGNYHFGVCTMAGW
jgi:hypothetical protein